eukprot:SRR837773.16678.p1 GENE.SRR837773.16678~~SRR837773.16678.p1  ORF type:complete len:233 (-),score=4.37 SRR837773.16678:15-674(-)
MGFLGFQHGGGMLVRFAVLFRDRLDSWNRTPCWGHPHGADGRLELRHLHKVDVCGEGLIIIHRMRRLGIHAGTEHEARAWQSALDACAGPIRGMGLGSMTARKATEQPALSPDSQASTDPGDEPPLRLSPPATPSPSTKSGFRSLRLVRPSELEPSTPQSGCRMLSPTHSQHSSTPSPQLRHVQQAPATQKHSPKCCGHAAVGCLHGSTQLRDVPSSPW